MNTFQYYEIRAAVEFTGHVDSFLGVPDERGNHTPAGAYAQALVVALEHDTEVFWTLYGIDEEGHALAIGDFVDFEAAYQVLYAILQPLAEARDLLSHRLGETAEQLQDKIRAATSVLEDVINQCSNGDRL